MSDGVDLACCECKTDHRQGNSNSKGDEGEKHAWWFSCIVSERVGSITWPPSPLPTGPCSRLEGGGQASGNRHASAGFGEGVHRRVRSTGLRSAQWHSR